MTPESLDARSFERKAREAGERFAPEIDRDAMAVAFNLIRATNRVVNDFETNVHRPAGLTWASWRIVFALWVAGPLQPRELARLSGVSRASISSALNTLERDGYVVRRRIRTDRRVVMVELTAHGSEVTGDLFRRQNAREREWASALSEREQATFVRLLHKLLAHHPAAPA